MKFSARRFFKSAVLVLLIILAVRFFSSDSDLSIDSAMPLEDEETFAGPATDGSASQIGVETPLPVPDLPVSYDPIAPPSHPGTNQNGMLTNLPGGGTAAGVKVPRIPVAPPPFELNRNSTTEAPPAAGRTYSGP